MADRIVAENATRAEISALSLTSCIGNTPLLRLERIAREFSPIEIYVKAEWFNPGGSVKDRAALSMILDGERRQALRPGKVIIDATSGNTGIAYAMIGINRGYKVKIFLPSNASPERKHILRAYGAELVLTDPALGTDGAIHEVREIYRQDPERYFYPDQYNNDANWKAHYETTGPEIIRQTNGGLTHFIAGLGTSGTFMGTGRRLREFNPSIRLISFQPDAGFHGLEGLKHMATALVPGIYDRSFADEDLAISTEEAQRWVRALARTEGLLVGLSSGAALAASFEVARRLKSEGKEGRIVTVFPDSGDKYLTDRFWEEE
jgi:cysteine synthase B